LGALLFGVSAPSSRRYVAPKRRAARPNSVGSGKAEFICT